MGNDVIVTSFLKLGQQFYVCEYFLLIPIHVPCFKLIEGQIKELQGVVPNPPLGLRMTKMPGQDRVKQSYYHFKLECPKIAHDFDEKKVAEVLSWSRTEKSFDWLKRRHYEWNTPGQDAN